MGFQFTKWQGLGNDFVLVDCFKETITDCNQLAIAVCDRHFGVGADGLVTISSSAVADFHMRIFNSDGSEAEMCGNVTRCVARYVYENGLTDKTKISLETGAGIIRPELIFEGDKVARVRVDMGEPKISPRYYSGGRAGGRYRHPYSGGSGRGSLLWYLCFHGKSALRYFYR